MKKRLATLILSICVMACAEQEVDRNYPAIETFEIVDNTSKGLVVSATFGDKMADAIIECGFTWANGGDFAGFGPLRENLGSPVNNAFTAEIQDRLVKGRSYFIRAYVRTKDQVVLSRAIQFISEGSLGISVDKISPTLVTGGDLVTISGARFGTNTSKIRVVLDTGFFNPTDVLIHSISTTTIVFVAPIYGKNFSAKVTVIHEDSGSKEAAEKLIWK